MDNLTNRKKQAINTKNKIYNKAIKLIIEKGYDKVTISEICKGAGVSIGSFYHYFKSKDDVIIEFYKKADKYFKEFSLRDAQNINAIDQILEFTNYSMEFVVAEKIDFFIQIYKSQLHGNDYFLSEDRSLVIALKNIINKGQENKELICDMSAAEMTNFILKIHRGIIYDWCVHKGSYDLVEEADKMMKRIVKIFLP